MNSPSIVLIIATNIGQLLIQQMYWAKHTEILLKHNFQNEVIKPEYAVEWRLLTDKLLKFRFLAQLRNMHTNESKYQHTTILQ